MWKIGTNKQTTVMDKKEFGKFLVGKQVVERTHYHQSSICVIKKYTKQQALKLDFWFCIRIYPKSYKDKQLSEYNFFPKKYWDVSVNKNLYYVTKLF
jgi:hypothetical protein